MQRYTGSNLLGGKYFGRILLSLTLFAVALIYSGCFKIATVNQVSTAMGGQTITSTLLVEVEGMSDPAAHYGIVGLLIPNDWTVNTVEFSGGYTDFCTFLHPDSSDKEPGGQVDYWTDSLEARYPSGADMQWVVYQSSQSHAVIEDTVDVNLSVVMTTGTTEGNYNIGYFVTDAALDFTDRSYYDISFNNPITISGIVPVELSSFSASVDKKGVQLKWETASETNNRGFEIQRSSDKNNFVTVGFVNGNGTTAGKNTYSYTDKNVGDGKFSYRLKQVDYDGKFEYSSIVEVDVVSLKDYEVMQNYPNPFNPTTAIQFGVPVDAKVTVTLYNSVGEMISVIADNNYSAGRYNLNIDGAGLSSGTYIYTVSAEGVDGSRFVQSHKMVLLK